jgi:hypothetical protein
MNGITYHERAFDPPENDRFVTFCYHFSNMLNDVLHNCLLNLYRWGLYQIGYWLTLSGATPTEATGDITGFTPRRSLDSWNGHGHKSYGENP